MGKSSKPLNIHVDTTLYEAHQAHWDTLTTQGYIITVISGERPDLYLAPYAMRMTADMLTQLPSTFKLAVAGARELRYAPKVAGASWKGGKGAKVKKARARKNSAVATETPSIGEPTVEGSLEGIRTE